ncbi:MAG: NAD-dependent epimerase/dehydratase family protein [Blastochloris viridis]|uniref:NAD-dependent epimerase/dehydratase family protein n=1 Tax=Blastochloris viridis TaxID=1079 RepID=A0A6N4RD65_BLAVI|nr:MAG: NAD-dependent epimerase/dehydratase family protein [Blastochloris viridis]
MTAAGATSARRTVFITGVAGFIGAALAGRMLTEGWHVVGMDNLNDYYTPVLKQARLDNLAQHPQAARFQFHKTDLVDRDAVITLLLETKPDVIVHLAAQASVRYGFTHQLPYLEANLMGHFHMLMACKALADAGHPLQHFLYASSSSVYGAKSNTPSAEALRETDNVNQPLSLYAATKVANELVTHAWCNQFKLRATGMRFFTVYGPWGRPDMAPVMFTRALLSGATIPLFNGGDLWRDFTYIDDIVEAIIRLVPVTPQGEVPHTIYNLGNQQPVQVGAFVTTLADVLGQQANIDAREWPPTEVYKTHADTTRLHAAVGWAPSTPLATGLQRLADWYRTTEHSLFTE